MKQSCAELLKPSTWVPFSDYTGHLQDDMHSFLDAVGHSEGGR